MDADLLKLALRSQTLFGGIQLILVVLSGATLIGLLHNTNNRDTFHCAPNPDVLAKQLCYDKYASTVPRNFVAITYAVLCVCWIFFMVYGALTLRQIKRDQQNENNQSTKFKRVYLCHVCFRLIFLAVMIALFCSYQTLSIPLMYKCSLANTTPITFNLTKTALYCHDQHYKDKSNLNIAIIAIEVFLLVLCICEVIHLITLTPEKLLNKLLGDIMAENNENEQRGETEITVRKPNLCSKGANNQINLALFLQP